MWFIGGEVEQETNATPPKKYPGSAPDHADKPIESVVYCFSKITLSFL